jgi:fumarylacetoacetase
MKPMTNETHDPARRSWVDSANAPGVEFPVQNLPFGAFRAGVGPVHLAVAIGDRVLDLAATADEGWLAGLDDRVISACRAPVLNDLMALGRPAWSALRARLSALLGADSPSPRPEHAVRAMADVDLVLPVTIGDYSDFYASVHHATNVGSMFRPDNPLLPNYQWVPIGYHGRASSIVPSGTPVRRPQGQLKEESAAAPVFGPSRRLDYECEVGCFIGPGNPLGTPIPIAEATEHIFGFTLLNDWSARDIQAWEYQPLGPFLSKSFATTVSPWIVTAEALAPFRGPLAARAPGDPAPLAYLDDPQDCALGGLDLGLEVLLVTARMREAGLPPIRLSSGSFLEMYWTPAQLVAHHASNGCNLRSGDLLGSGTISGPTEGSRGCLLELTWRGSRPLTLPTGEVRRFLEDGDEIVMRGTCRRDGWVPIGFGECRGKIIG